MKRILINATHNEEIRVALCKDSYLYDFDLENRTREQKKANIYKGYITRIEQSLEAVFVEYGAARQGFLPLREIAPEYLHGNREDNLKKIIKEGDELIIQIEKEERGNKGAAVSTFISLAGRYLVLMPNNSKGGGISRQIAGKVREDMRQVISELEIPKGMSVIVRTAGIGKTSEDLQNDLNHLLDSWQSILNTHNSQRAPCLLYQEAGVVTRAMRDYLRDDIAEIWIDSENAYNEAANFISSVMPAQMTKLRKYTDFEPMFVRFGVEKQIESAYQREVRLPSGGAIVIDQTEALVSIDINSAKSTKGSDVAQTAYHTNLEAADEIARQLRLRDMGGLIVIDFIDMADPRHQKEVEKRLIDATRYDRARVQFAEISKFGLMEMSRQRLRPSLEEATGYICPRCHGNGMIRDVRSLALSIMRAIEQLALKHRNGEVQAEVPTEIAAFLLNEKRESLVYLEQDTGTRITVLPHAHLESPNYSLHFNPDGFAPATYDRITDVEEALIGHRGYEVNWQTQPIAQTHTNHWQTTQKPQSHNTPESAPKPQAVAWLANLFAPKPQATLDDALTKEDAAQALETLVNQGNKALGSIATLVAPKAKPEDKAKKPKAKKETKETQTYTTTSEVSEKPKQSDAPRPKPVKDNATKDSFIEPKTDTKATKQDTKTSDNKPADSKADQKALETKTKKSSDFAIHIQRLPKNTQAPTVVALDLDSTDQKARPVSVLDTDTQPKAKPTPPTQPKSVVPTTTPTQELVTNQNLAPKPSRRVQNDPRMVAPVKSIKGSAGDFVRAWLTNGDTRLTQESFVACFVEALAQYARPFDFRNYGYESLSAEQISAFTEATHATAHHHTQAGKTASTPKASRRVQNDPRNAQQGSQVNHKPALAHDDTPSAKPQDDTPSDPRPLPSATPSDSSVGNEGTTDSHTNDPVSDNAIFQNYKNMIENIAEQLLPSTGLLKLATPKKPAKKATPKNPTKVAIKIPKTEQKPQAEVRKRKPKESKQPTDLESQSDDTL